jgi:hypothetical protein
MGLAELFGQLLLDHYLLAGGTIALLLVLRRLLPSAFTGWRGRLAVLYPIAIAIGGAFAGLSTYEKPAEKVVVGLIVGLLASLVFKLAKPLLRRLLKKTFAFTDDELRQAEAVIERHNGDADDEIRAYPQ